MKTKILLVEEGILLQYVFESLLSSLNCKVDVCKTANEALRKYKKNKSYQLILTEIGFTKGFPGYDLSEKIREHENQHFPHKRIPIIGITSTLSNKLEQFYLDKGMDMIYKKPILKDQLEEILKIFVKENNL